MADLDYRIQCGTLKLAARYWNVCLVDLCRLQGWLYFWRLDSEKYSSLTLLLSLFCCVYKLQLVQLRSLKLNYLESGLLYSSTTWHEPTVLNPLAPLEATTQNGMTSFGSSRFQTIGMNYNNSATFTFLSRSPFRVHLTWTTAHSHVEHAQLKHVCQASFVQPTGRLRLPKKNWHKSPKWPSIQAPLRVFALNSHWPKIHGRRLWKRPQTKKKYSKALMTQHKRPIEAVWNIRNLMCFLPSLPQVLTSFMDCNGLPLPSTNR